MWGISFTLEVYFICPDSQNVTAITVWRCGSRTWSSTSRSRNMNHAQRPSPRSEWSTSLLTSRWKTKCISKDTTSTTSKWFVSCCFEVRQFYISIQQNMELNTCDLLGSSTWRWSPWCLKTPCLRSATLRTSPPYTPSLETAPSLPVCSTTQVNMIRNGSVLKGTEVYCFLIY